MSPQLSNRIVFLLACAGIGLTLFLGLAHASGASVPCGAHTEGVLSGCDKVAQDGWSRVLGIPIAFLGFGMYLLVGVLTFFREVLGVKRSPNLANAIWAILAAAAVGAGMMLGRTYFVIGTSCMWCLASHILTFGAFVIHSLGTAGLKKSDPATGKRIPWYVFPVLLAIGAASGGVPGYNLFASQKARLSGGDFDNKTGTPLFRDYNPVFGNADAKITIVEFSDLHCPICKHWHGWLQTRVRERFASSVRIVFRSFPIAELHPHATTAALYAEYARRHGRFWEFAELNYENQEGITQEKLGELLDQIGLDSAEAAGIINDPEKLRDYLKNIKQDMDDGLKLSVSQTPWWFIVYPNGDTEYAIGGGISDRVESKKFLAAAGGG